MRIAMIGGGYVGLVSAACFADLGTEVAIVETDPERLHMLREGRMRSMSRALNGWSPIARTRLMRPAVPTR